MEIDIDFDVYKALTARRISETHTYNDVIRELLGLDSVLEQESDPDVFGVAAVSDQLAKFIKGGGFVSRGISLPNGTKLRARYRQKDYYSAIKDDKWIAEDGREFVSASAAAAAITGTNVNGLRFWEAKRPGDEGWRRLELLRRP